MRIKGRETEKVWYSKQQLWPWDSKTCTLSYCKASPNLKSIMPSALITYIARNNNSRPNSRRYFNHRK